MATKTLYERFSRFIPVGNQKEIFDLAEIKSLKVDKERKAVELHIFLPKLFSVGILYSLEEAIKEEYELSIFRILPEYPSELFNISYMADIVREAARVGTVINGFFNDMKCSIEGNTITVKIPFLQGGIDLLDTAYTADVFSNIIFSEFGVRYKVIIEKTEDAGAVYADYISKQLSSINSKSKEIYEAEEKRREAATFTANTPQTSNENDTPAFPRVHSLFPGKDTVDIDGDIITSGKMKFDLSTLSSVIGEEFVPDEIRPLRTITDTEKNVTVVGEVFSVEAEETKKHDKMRITISMTDKDSSLTVKIMTAIESSAEITDNIFPGKSYLIKGSIKRDTFDGELFMQYSSIMGIKRVLREDKSEEKRIELHLHTNMSAMDALTKPDQVVKTAARWGHEAVAITDHGNLQGFPIAMETSEKLAKDGKNIKVIYGLEAYFVDDTSRAAYKGDGITFDDEFIVFDIETTGLSYITCGITEIGAVLYSKGKILKKYNTFVNPGMPIPAEVSKLTGITDEMVADARDITEVLPEFFEFCGTRMLIAHNASFDTGFIRAAAEKHGIPFTSPYMDTVALSRYLNPTLKNHKLDTLAEHYNLGDFNHHRASDDAEMLALIFDKMANEFKDEGIADISRMNYLMSEKSDPLKLKTYHQIILVKNQTGLKNLYKLVSDSYLKYYRRHPRIPKTRLEELREGLIIGSACEAGELYRAILDNKPEDELIEIASFYDYLEIQPLCNNEFLVREKTVADEEALKDINRRIIELGRKCNKPVVATCDVHYLDPEDDVYRRILWSVMSSKKKKEGDAPAEEEENKLFFRTTEEMMAEFAYLGEELCHEVVIENPKKISDMIEQVRPIPKGNYPPHIDGSEEELTEKCHSLAKELYGDPLPEEVSSRLERELDSIIKNGYAIMYIIARKLVENSEEKGYQVGSRGSVGSSFAATMAGITKVNPLPPHYRCPKCKYTDFSSMKTEQPECKSGFDLMPKDCPVCGTPLYRDGHDIPFETFLGFYGDKVPDIDLNFSGDVQGDAHKFTEVLFGEGKAFKAGTIGTLASKTAYGYVKKYLEDRQVSVSKAEENRLVSGCEGIKRTTGQHPGGIIVVPNEYEVYDFCPVQHPADDPNSSIITTHFEFKYLHDTILKLDILGHDIPTKYKRLEEYSGMNILDVTMSDPKVYKLFTSPEPLGVTAEQIYAQTGTMGLPEMGTRFIRGVLVDAKPENFADLLQISGLTHGTGVWLGNADELIKNNVCTIKDVIGCRDDIMMVLIQKYGMEKSLSFKIMEFVRKNKKGVIIPQEMQDAMRAANVPEWYIDSLQKIRYMFPKAHAVAYVMDALRLAWFKVYKPVVFYAAYFTAAPDGFDSEIVMGGKGKVKTVIDEYSKPGANLSQKDADVLDALYLVNEYYQRGYSFLPVNIYKSTAHKYVPEDGKIRLPFDSLPGVGTNAAENIVKAMESGKVYCIDDLKRESGISKSVLEVLNKNDVFKGMPETDQIVMDWGI